MDINTLLSAGVVLVTAVWAISKIKTITAVLVERISNLVISVEKLNASISKIDNDVDQLKTRVARLEERTKAA